ncbi:MAG: hydantoinase B/oxoprolinase family protein [Gaiellaceae bacterium]
MPAETGVQETVVHRYAERPRRGDETAVDPITTEVVRHGLISAAEQMKRALVRTAFNPIIYEVLDFAVAIYDREVRLLSQALGMQHFMGRLSFGIEASVAAVGGEETLEPGDILFYNVPYLSGAHANDAAVLMPVFVEDELIGYTAITAHWLDVGGKDPYSTDTVDVFQEGTLFPGVKLYRRGTLDDDLYRTLLANCRVPKLLAGDLNAEIVGLRTGATAFAKIVERHGREVFEAVVERMLDHGEATVRAFFERIPDGRYVAGAVLDSDGVGDEEIPFDVVVEVEGSSVRVDFSGVPDALPGPLNCPQPGTVSSTRMALMMLAGGGDAPNDGHFRPIEVVTRPGSMFHPLPPSPCFLYGWPFLQSTEAMYHALAQANPEIAPAWSGGDILTIVWWGNREATGEPWADASPHPIGQGASARGDGASALMHHLQSATRFSPVEVWEVRDPWIVESVELAADSGGPGRYRGGLGLDFTFRVLEDLNITAVIERTKNPPPGLVGGGEGRPNSATLRYPDGRRVAIAKDTRVPLPKGTLVELHCGGGGGFGDPAERDPEDVAIDLREGYVTEAHARRWYPHAFG